MNDVMPTFDVVAGDGQTLERVILHLCKEFGLLPAEHLTLRKVIESLKQPVAGRSMLPQEATRVHVDIPEEFWGAPSARGILKACVDLAVFLMGKNLRYGDSALKPLRILSKANAVEQIKVRMDDKLSRMFRGQSGGEDAIKDLVGYWILLQVAGGGDDAGG